MLIVTHQLHRSYYTVPIWEATNDGVTMSVDTSRLKQRGKGRGKGKHLPVEIKLAAVLRSVSELLAALFAAVAADG